MSKDECRLFQAMMLNSKTSGKAKHYIVSNAAIADPIGMAIRS
jgi:hypothetical protein